MSDPVVTRALVMEKMDSTMRAYQQDLSSQVAFGEILVERAMSYLRQPYSDKPNPPNTFDCSTFVVWCAKEAGNPGLLQTSYGSGRGSRDLFRSCTSFVAKGNLQPGDLVFTKNDISDKDVGHVAIYIGGGKIIHAVEGSSKCVKVNYLIDSWLQKDGTRRSYDQLTMGYGRLGFGITSSSPASLERSRRNISF